MTQFVIRRMRYEPAGVFPSVFGPYDNPEEAERNLRAWAESKGIPLGTGMPYPECSFWTEDGSVMFHIEPFMGTITRKDIE